MTLSKPEVQKYYDRFGKKQDSQGFYEDPALDCLISQGRFEQARNVFEFGCGTGKFAARLLAKHLPHDSRYCGCDVSPTMIGLAGEKLQPYQNRSEVLLTDGSVKFPGADHSIDRVISAYVLDLLPDADIKSFVDEAYRVLNDDGLLCLVSLTNGTTALSRAVSRLWSVVFRMRPSLVGGCRPINLQEHVDSRRWNIEFNETVVAFGVPSEVVIARPLATATEGDAET
jgi:ubiquinone/menaquinone biosynthesis C-methylase UbiE